MNKLNVNQSLNAAAQDVANSNACPKHGRNATYTITQIEEGVSVQFTACCNQFLDTVTEKYDAQCMECLADDMVKHIFP